jgi:ubiquinone/menaquinone biosynthesis C-methylase UbiE
MNKQDDKIDWSDQCWKEMLIYQRKSIWLEDTLDKIVAWIGFKDGMSVVDVGCGLGYLGYTFWPYFGKGGQYIGIDVSSKLIDDAEKHALEWATGGETHFQVGDACSLSLEDDTADMAMCQTLLMHLENPEKALSEMIRVIKPGGSVVCFEPDNVSPAMAGFYSSLPEFDITDRLLITKFIYISNQGRIKLGGGDKMIGPKVPHMMKTFGLTEIVVRISDRVHYLEPPYDDPLQQRAMGFIQKQIFDKNRRETLMEKEKKEFLAGGGDPEDYKCIRKILDKMHTTMKQQIDDNEYFTCGSGDFYIIIGKKSG